MTPQIKQRIEQIRRGEVPEGYKNTKAGVIPSEWEIHILSKHLTESRMPGTNGAVAKKLTVKLWNKGVVEKREIHEGSESTTYYRRKSGQLIYSKLDFLNCAFGIIPEHLDGYESTLDLPCFDIKDVSSYYLLTYITQRNFYERFGMIADGGRKARRVGPEDMLSFPLVYPSFAEQRKIAEILSTQDKLIVLKEKRIEEKKRQKKYLVQQLFTGKKRLPGFFKKWDFCKLVDILVEGNKVGVEDTSKYRKMTVKLAFKGLELARQTREMADTRPFYVRNKNEIIIGKQNYFNGSVALVTDEFDGCICSNAIMSFSCENANAKYVLEYISQTDFMKKHEMLANGTGQKELSEKDFLNFKIRLPSIEEQNAIAEVLDTIDKEINLLQKDLDKEKQKKKALMQLLLTGIVRVNI